MKLIFYVFALKIFTFTSKLLYSKHSMKITCFIPESSQQQLAATIASLKKSTSVGKIYILCSSDTSVEGAEVLTIDHLHSTQTIQSISSNSSEDFTLIYTKDSALQMGTFALERLIQIAQDADAGMVYADHYKMVEGARKNHPLIAYQKGSLRDDFDFGSVLIFKTSSLQQAVANMKIQYSYAGLYDLRLKVSQQASLVHVNEYLYTEVEDDTRKSGEKQFDYVDPKNRAVQIEMEQACTEHLKSIGAYLQPVFKSIAFDKGEFEYEASVIIPVRNRAKTIGDAIQSVFSQKTNFRFNLIVVDNYSTDGTSEIVDSFKEDKRLIHLVPESTDLGIGGCWNAGVFHPTCGKFAVQLDSDDIYSDENTLQKIVDAFYEQQCAMVVGTYKLTDFDLNTLPPGVIDHKEWTPENGRNNALRINGLGAPRAFYTPLLREIRVPNTSYGEDYALGLEFSREYQIGRIYDVLYLCRRWEGNSDASLDVVKTNANNTYKDRLRTWEVEARIKLNKK